MVNNFADGTKVLFGCSLISDAEYNVQNVSIPGITFSHPELGSKFGYNKYASADTVTFDSLSVVILLDEKLEYWKDIVNRVMGVYDVEGPTAWLEIYDSFDEKLFKINFTSCRVESIGQLEFDMTSQGETPPVLPIEIKFEKMEIE